MRNLLVGVLILWTTTASSQFFDLYTNKYRLEMTIEPVSFFLGKPILGSANCIVTISPSHCEVEIYNAETGKFMYSVKGPKVPSSFQYVENNKNSIHEEVWFLTAKDKYEDEMIDLTIKEDVNGGSISFSWIILSKAGGNTQIKARRGLKKE